MRLTDHGEALRDKAQLVLNAGNDLKLKARTLQGVLTGQAKLGQLLAWEVAVVQKEVRCHLSRGLSHVSLSVLARPSTSNASPVVHV